MAGLERSNGYECEIDNAVRRMIAAGRALVALSSILRPALKDDT